MSSKRLWTPIFDHRAGQCVCFIPLTQKQWAIIDAKHFESVRVYSWFAWRSGTTYYAFTNTNWSDGRRRKLSLHQLIWTLLSKEEAPVDHKNRNGLDCREYNLRPGPSGLNQANQHKQKRP